MAQVKTTLTRIGKLKWVMTLIGAAMIHFMLGNMYSLSNLSKYLVSLMVVKYNQAVLISSFSLVIAALMQTMLPGIAAIYFLEKKLSIKTILLIASVIYAIGSLLSGIYPNNFISYLTNQGYVVGIAKGMLYLPPIRLAGQWFPEYKGLSSGIILGCFGVSSMFFNLAQYYMINPNNTKPEVYGGYKGKLYTSPELLTAVENYLIVFALIQTIVVFLGWSFLWDPKNKQKHERRIQINEDSEGSEHNDASDHEEEEDHVPGDPNSVYVKNYKIGIMNFLSLRTVYKYFLVFIVNNLLMLYISTNYTMGYGADLYSDSTTTWIGTIGSGFNFLGRLVGGTLCDYFPTYKVMQGTFISWIVAIALHIFFGTYDDGTLFGISNWIGFTCLGAFMAANVVLQMDTVGAQNMQLYSAFLQAGQAGASLLGSLVMNWFYSKLDNKLAFLYLLLTIVTCLMALLFCWGRSISDAYVIEKSKVEIAEEQHKNKQNQHISPIPLQTISNINETARNVQ